MIDLRRPLAVLLEEVPLGMLEESLRPLFELRDRKGRQFFADDLVGINLQITGAGVCNAGRPRLPIRLQVSMLYLKYAYNVSDQELVVRWTENVQW